MRETEHLINQALLEDVQMEMAEAQRELRLLEMMNEEEQEVFDEIHRNTVLELAKATKLSIETVTHFLTA